MKKKLVFMLALLLSLFLFPVQTSAAEAFTITNYHVDMTVNEDNSAQIVETISVDFNEYRHGIYRSIPVKSYITNFVDGQDLTQVKRFKITDIDVSGEEFETSRYSDYLEIKIGSADYKIIGKHTYVISYKVESEDDKINAYDYVYWNLIGGDWDTTIDKASFTITMPKAFDTSLINFTSGGYGSIQNDKVSYEVNNKHNHC